LETGTFITKSLYLATFIPPTRPGYEAEITSHIGTQVDHTTLDLISGSKRVR